MTLLCGLRTPHGTVVTADRRVVLTNSSSIISPMCKLVEVLNPATQTTALVIAIAGETRSICVMQEATAQLYTQYAAGGVAALVRTMRQALVDDGHKPYTTPGCTDYPTQFIVAAPGGQLWGMGGDLVYHPAPAPYTLVAMGCGADLAYGAWAMAMRHPQHPVSLDALQVGTLLGSVHNIASEHSYACGDGWDMRWLSNG